MRFQHCRVVTCHPQAVDIRRTSSWLIVAHKIVALHPWIPTNRRKLPARVARLLTPRAPPMSSAPKKPEKRGARAARLPMPRARPMNSARKKPEKRAAREVKARSEERRVGKGSRTQRTAEEDK